jgi:hypothetical protein
MKKLLFIILFLISACVTDAQHYPFIELNNKEPTNDIVSSVDIKRFKIAFDVHRCSLTRRASGVECIDIGDFSVSERLSDTTARIFIQKYNAKYNAKFNAMKDVEIKEISVFSKNKGASVIYEISGVLLETKQ